MIVVKSKIKEHTNDLNVGGDFAEALDKEIKSMITRACDRCRSNNRKTLQARDL